MLRGRPMGSWQRVPSTYVTIGENGQNIYFNSSREQSASVEDFSNSFVKHPYITDSRINYESLLGKNKEAFLKVNLFNQTNKLNYSSLLPIFYSFLEN